MEWLQQIQKVMLCYSLALWGRYVMKMIALHHGKNVELETNFSCSSKLIEYLAICYGMAVVTFLQEGVAILRALRGLHVMNMRDLNQKKNDLKRISHLHRY